MAVTKLSNSGIKTGVLKYDSMLAGNAPFDPAATWLIQRVNGTGSSGVITFSNIPQTYQHLQIRFIAKNSTTTSVADHLYLQANGLTTSTYYSHFMYGSGTAAFAGNFMTQPQVTIRDAIYRSNATYPNMFGVGIIDIHDYTNTSKLKTVRAFTGRDGNGDGVVTLSSGVYPATSAITSLTLSSATGNFTTTTSFALYGFKG